MKSREPIRPFFNYFFLSLYFKRLRFSKRMSSPFHSTSHFFPSSRAAIAMHKARHLIHTKWPVKFRALKQLQGNFWSTILALCAGEKGLTTGTYPCIFILCTLLTLKPSFVNLSPYRHGKFNIVLLSVCSEYINSPRTIRILIKTTRGINYMFFNYIRKRQREDRNY